MYMFRSKRSQLTRRLLRSRIRDTDSGIDDETRSETQVRHHLKRLKENQLELLLSAIEGCGQDVSACVLLPRDCSPTRPEAHLLCCQMWRWPELRHAEELKRLPVCASATDPVYVCCNPYHLSRLVYKPDSPPPYERYETERLKPEDRAPSELPYLCGDRWSGSLTTSGEGGLNSVGKNGEWCRLAYWEMSRRVGRQFSVEAPNVNVFADVPHGDGLCLATLISATQQPRQITPEQVVRTRAKIKHGVILSREPDGVWAYNLSTSPIFVNSPTLAAMTSCTQPSLVVFRVPPGHCLCIWEPHITTCSPAAVPNIGPVDPHSVRISFAKGWGGSYSRREITACPCWLEVLLAPCR